MRSSSLFAAFVSVACAALQVSASVDSLPAAGRLVQRDSPAAPARSRHANRQSRQLSSLSGGSKLKRRGSSGKKCKSKSSSSSSSSSTKQVVSASGNTTSSSSAPDFDLAADYLKVGNVFIGMLPDDGSGGGKAESFSSLNAILPKPAFASGRYAQVSNGKIFDGSQLYQVLDDVKKNGAILHASVMPYGTWYGLTESDNRNAIAIAKVCKDIEENHGVEVWLRFAHEMNWYQVDGTYSGGVEDFQTGWKVVAKAVKEISPNTKMWWSPNVGSMEDYKRYYPREGAVDVVGFDYYPQSADASFLKQAQPFYDEFVKDDIIMVQGETGLHYPGSDEEKMQWLKSLTSAETQAAMPKYVGACWFNYDKFENGRQTDFRIVYSGQSASSGMNAKTVSYFSQ